MLSLSFEGDIVNNEEKNKLLTNSDSETILHLLGKLDMYQSLDELKYSSYVPLFLSSIINMSHHPLISCCTAHLTGALISLPSNTSTQE